jgi:hypothetical protein
MFIPMTDRPAIESAHALACNFDFGVGERERLRVLIEADRKAVALAVLDELDRIPAEGLRGVTHAKLRRRIESGEFKP